MENGLLFAELYGLPRSEALRVPLQTLFTSLGLDDTLDVPTREYSYGMKKKLLIAEALVHDPDLLIMDEPALGLDPPSRAALLRILEERSRKGVCTLAATNDPTLAQELATTVVLLNEGEVVAHGSPAELLAKVGGATRIEVHVAGSLLGTQATAPSFAGLPADILSIQQLPGRIIAESRSGPDVLPQLVTAVLGAGLKIERIDLREPNLTDVFTLFHRPGLGHREPGLRHRQPGLGSREPGLGSRERERVTLAVWRAEWLTAVRRRRLLLFNILIPLTFVATIALSSAPAVHAAAVFTVLFALFGTFGSSIPLIRDGESGLLRRYVLTGVHPGGLLLQRVFAAVALDLIELAPSVLVIVAARGELGFPGGHGRAGDGTRAGRGERARRTHRRLGQISRRGSPLLGRGCPPAPALGGDVSFSPSWNMASHFGDVESVPPSP